MSIDLQPNNRRRALFTVLGVPLTIAPNSWQFVPPKMIIGLLAALLVLPGQPIPDRLAWGVVYGLILLVILILHIIDHLASSQFVSPRMTELRITPRLIETRYDSDPGDLPGRVHLVRAIGVPSINIVLSLGSGLIWLAADHHSVLFFAGANLALAIFVLLPIPDVDGEVIWREASRRMGGVS